jgi:hypothetical protein
MSESVDLRKLLAAWPYDAENDARLVPGDDGRQILQVRTPVGIEQYELEGRPDGLHPHGKESFLEYHLSRLQQAEREGNAQEFSLSPADCAELFNEGTLFYFRYVRLFQLRDWARTIRDTARNLRAFDFIRRYAEREEDQGFLEKWRPYVVRVNATATAMENLDNRAYDAAIDAISQAIETVENLDSQEDETFRFERERSLVALRDLRGQIKRDRPMSQLEQLEHQLRRAIERQEFERAAQLRDKIKAAKSHSPS